MVNRYFITDESNIGTLISGRLMPKEMILILGKKLYENKNISDIVLFLKEHFYFQVEAERITFKELNSGKYPYINAEAEVQYTSAFSFDEAIHNAFEELSLNRSFTEKQQKFLDRIKVDYSELTSRWSIPNKAHDKSNTAANAKFGTKRKTAYEILEDCLNLQSTKVKDRVERDVKEVSVINQSETEFAQEKQRQLQEAFKKWIYAEPDRRDEVVDRYNRMLNSTRPREYDGSKLEFPGMNNEITLRKHQRDAVAHALYGGNTLFAHEVGAGKSATRS